MTRMSREFSLVLLGASMLTAGYFLTPEDDLEKKAEQEVTRQVAGGHHRGGLVHTWVYVGSGRRGVSAAPARAAVARGGFGGMGSSMSAAS